MRQISHRIEYNCMQDHFYALSGCISFPQLLSFGIEILFFLTMVDFVGTGYLTACFALMVGPEGRAVGVEHIPELVTSSVQSIEKSAAASLLKQGSLSVHIAGM